MRTTVLDALTAPPEIDDGLQSLSATLVSLAKERCELWHDPDGNGYASFEREDHREHWNIQSAGFREWLSWIGHTECGGAPAGETIKTAQTTLSGTARFDGDEHKVFKRVARDESGYWIDLCDDHWRAVLVTAAGWRIVDAPSVRFTRSKAMRPLPVPKVVGDYNLLWGIVNIPEDMRLLVLAWEVEALRDGTPYVVLELIGEHGSAKSSTQTALRTFIDPNKVMLRAAPRTREDIFVAAANGHVVSFENGSSLSLNFSDGLCTVATGDGFAGRQLYTDGEEHVIESLNPVMINGINAVITRPDLLDRAIVAVLPSIEYRLTDAEHKARLSEHAPGILGGLLDLFATALRNLPDVSIPAEQLPRMADFTLLGEAIARAQALESGTFLNQYVAHRAEAVYRTIESSPVAMACKQFVDAGKEHIGTVSSLLTRLGAFVDRFALERGDYWPRSPRGLGDALRRNAPSLRQVGIDCGVEIKHREDGIHCWLHPVRSEHPVRCNGQSQGAHASVSPEEDVQPHDALSVESQDGMDFDDAQDHGTHTHEEPTVVRYNVQDVHDIQPDGEESERPVRRNGQSHGAHASVSPDGNVQVKAPARKLRKGKTGAAPPPPHFNIRYTPLDVALAEIHKALCEHPVIYVGTNDARVAELRALGPELHFEPIGMYLWQTSLLTETH